jgi:hypothetical protein
MLLHERLRVYEAASVKSGRQREIICFVVVRLNPCRGVHSCAMSRRATDMKAPSKLVEKVQAG